MAYQTFLTNIAYLIQQTDTVYSDKLNTAYRSPDITAETDSSYLISVLDFLYYLSSEQILLMFLPLLQIVSIRVRITSITINGKDAYELKGRFLDDLRENAFSGTNEEDAVEHIEYFLKIVDPIDLPNVNHERLRLVVFPISLIGNASKWLWEHMLTWNTTYLILNLVNGDDEVEFINEEFSNLDDKNLIDKEEVAEIFRIETDIFDFEPPLCKAFDEFNYLLNNGKAKWPTCNSNEDGFCNDGELPGMVQVGYMTYFHDYEWYNDLTDSSLKDIALKQKLFVRSHGEMQRKNEEEQHKEGRCGLFEDPAQKPPVCKIRRFEMKKYSFGQEEEYVAIKEYEYDDLTNEDACQAYQEIFRNMDEGWLVTRAE
ncbi:hypothetical protein Tco_0583471 [Tanacetum coccineum]